MSYRTLPFPRGQSLTNGVTLIGHSGTKSSRLPSSTGIYDEATPFGRDLASKRAIQVLDEQLSNGGTTGASGTILVPGTMQPIKLRAVQAGADITVSKHGLLVQFDTTAGRFGVVTAETYAAADGVACLPIDGAYPIGTSISKYDWFYVVDEGICYVSVANGATVTASGAVASGANGLAAPATAGEAVVGISQEEVTGNGTASHDVARMYVTGLRMSDASG